MKSQIRWIVLCAISISCLVGCGPVTPRTTLHEAVEKGNLDLVQRHITAKSDLNKPDATGWTPLQLAAMKGDLAIVTALAEAGADVKRAGKDGKTALDVAREKNQTAIVDYLQKRSAKKPGRGLIDGGLGVSEAMDNM